LTARERLQKEKTNLSTRMRAIDRLINRAKGEAAATSDTSQQYWSALNKKVDGLYNEMNSVFEKYTGYAIPLSYRAKAIEEIERIRELKTIAKKTRSIAVNLNSPFHKNTISALVDDTAAIFYNANRAGKQMVASLLRQTQQQLIREVRINKAIARGLAEGGTIRTVKKSILTELQKKLGEDFTIKAGSRRFKADYYAELVARTKTRDAQSQGVINTATEYGTDLVEVDSHNTTTAICLPYEGKVFSISGRDPDFPVLFDVPPFHPNCLHNITIIFKEVLERRGIDKYIDFANDNTEIHPTRTSHIPISKRKTA